MEIITLATADRGGSRLASYNEEFRRDLYLTTQVGWAFHAPATDAFLHLTDGARAINRKLFRLGLLIGSGKRGTFSSRQDREFRITQRSWPP